MSREDALPDRGWPLLHPEELIEPEFSREGEAVAIVDHAESHICVRRLDIDGDPRGAAMAHDVRERLMCEVKDILSEDRGKCAVEAAHLQRDLSAPLTLDALAHIAEALLEVPLPRLWRVERSGARQ